MRKRERRGEMSDPGPDFIILGAQRSGTTSLFEALMSHPLASRPPQRELHFFDLNYWRGKRWYERRLQRDRGRFTGESSPYYLFHPSVPARIAATYPDVPLIALLRDPIARAWSQHRFNMATGRESFEFLDALGAEAERLDAARPGRIPRKRIAHRDHSYIARGDYASQLARWRSVVNPDRLLVLRSEDVFDSPHEAHQRILAHLGIAPAPLEVSHRHGEGASLPDDVRRLAAPFFSRLEETRLT